MPRGPLTFRQRDLRAAVKAVSDAGLSVARVEVDKNGKIVVHTNQSAVVPLRPDDDPEWNEWDHQDAVA